MYVKSFYNNKAPSKYNVKRELEPLHVFNSQHVLHSYRTEGGFVL